MGSYLRPIELGEALDALADGRSAVVAGGTDFYPARVGRALDDDVVDISALDGLRGIREADGVYVIGALTTWSDLVRTQLPNLFGGLVRAARELGGVQIQNAGTIAGNVCHASAAADGVPCLLALDAEVELASAGGRRRLPIGDFVRGNRRTECGACELVTAIRVPRPAGPARSTFLKLGARRYLVISIAMVAATIEVAEDGTVAAARVAVGACSSVACRLPALERRLEGQPLAAALADQARAADLAPLAPIDDLRGSADYRLDAALTLVRRALVEIAEAAP